MNKPTTVRKSLAKNRRGATAVEYAGITVCLAIGTFLAAKKLGYKAGQVHATAAGNLTNQ